MAGPALSYSTAGQDPSGTTIYNGTLAANTTSSRFAIDANTGGMFGVEIGIEVVTGTAAGTNGLRLDVYAKVDATNYSDVANCTYSLTGLSSSSTKRCVPFRLPTGLYQGTVTNLDATNALSGVKITASKLA